MTAEDDAAFRAAYDAVSLSLADGKPILWAARLLGTPVPEKVSGSDLIEPLLSPGGAFGWRVFLLGGAPGVAEAAAERARRTSASNVVGTASPFIRLDGSPGDLEQGIEEVVAARPDLVLVAMGAPKQERWIHHNRERLGAAVGVGVGASLDFVVGRISPGAPMGLERRAGVALPARSRTAAPRPSLPGEGPQVSRRAGPDGKAPAGERVATRP